MTSNLSLKVMNILLPYHSKKCYTFDKTGENECLIAKIPSHFYYKDNIFYSKEQLYKYFLTFFISACARVLIFIYVEYQIKRVPLWKFIYKE